MEVQEINLNQIIINNFIKSIDELRHDLISRSGLSNKKCIDGSTFDLIWVTTMNYINPSKLIFDSINHPDPEMYYKANIEDYKTNFRNKFMSLFHNIVIKKQHFNWNWP